MFIEPGWKPGEADRAKGPWGGHYGKGRNGEGSKWHAATAHPRARDTRNRDRREWRREQGL